MWRQGSLALVNQTHDNATRRVNSKLNANGGRDSLPRGTKPPPDFAGIHTASAQG